MTIGFLLDDSLDTPDGVQQYVLTLGQWLSKQGHEVHYLVGQTKRSDIANIHSLAKIKRVRFNANVVGTPLPANKAAIKALLHQLQLDILHVQLPYSPLLAGRVIAASLPKTAIIGTLHIFPKTKLEHKLNHILKIINTPTLKRFDEIVAVSKVAAEASHLRESSKLKIIPNPVAIERFQPKNPVAHKGLTIVFLGRLVQRKGCAYLLEVLSTMHKHHELPDDMQVRIGGGGHLRAPLEAFVERENIQDIVMFEGFISEADKPAFLQSADIAIYPSSGGESFGIVLTEAMAAGAVTLGGKNPGYSCVLGENSPALFDTSNIESLRQLLLKLLTDKKFYTQLKASQQARVQDFDINTVGADISEVYTKALHRRHNMA